MKTTSNPIDNLPFKLIAGGLVLVCLVLGVVGLVLPIIPGVLFLAIAALIAARHFPSIARRLRRNRTLGRHLESTEAFVSLPVRQKAQLSCLLCVKILLDGIAFVAAVGTAIVARGRAR